MRPALTFPLFLLTGLCFPGTEVRAADKMDKALSAFSRGETLSWDQLEVVAAEAGLSPEKIAQMKLKDRMNRLAQQFNVRVEVSDFSGGMPPEEEFRLYKDPRGGKASLLMNADFWAKGQGVYDNDAFLAYLLFRAEAYYYYRSRYDAEHCTWLVEENSPSMKILKRAVEGSQARWTLEDGEPTLRDQEFRRTLEPSQDPARTLKKLVEYSLRQIAQRAADDWALLRFQKTVGKPSAQILVHGQKRERILAADFARGRSAMTRSERLAFERLMKSPFRYTRQMPGAGSEPVYDAELPAP